MSADSSSVSLSSPNSSPVKSAAASVRAPPPVPSSPANVLSPSDWQANSTHCQRCGASFTLISRCHHCRLCGLSVCSSCSAKRIPVAGEAVRVCDACFDRSAILIIAKNETEKQRKTEQEISTQGRAESAAAAVPINSVFAAAAAAAVAEFEASNGEILRRTSVESAAAAAVGLSVPGHSAALAPLAIARANSSSALNTQPIAHTPKSLAASSSSVPSDSIVSPRSAESESSPAGPISAASSLPLSDSIVAESLPDTNTSPSPPVSSSSPATSSVAAPSSPPSSSSVPSSSLTSPGYSTAQRGRVVFNDDGTFRLETESDQGKNKLDERNTHYTTLDSSGKPKAKNQNGTGNQPNQQATESASVDGAAKSSAPAASSAPLPALLHHPVSSFVPPEQTINLMSMSRDSRTGLISNNNNFIPLTSPIFTNFRQRIRSIHQLIGQREAQLLKNQQGKYKSERQILDDQIAHTQLIIDNLKRELGRAAQQRGEPFDPSAIDDERLSYFTKLQSEYQSKSRSLELERHIPDLSGRRWKLRVAAEEGLFIGAQDIHIEKVSGFFHLNAIDSKILFEIEDFNAFLNVYEFRIDGKGKGKLLGSFLSPERVSLQLVARRIAIPLVFKPAANSSSAHSRVGVWEVKREEAVLDIRIVKSIKGAATLPDSLINWFSNTFLPKLIFSLLNDTLPPELGPFLACEQQIALQGSFCVLGEFSVGVLEAPLDQLSGDSERARQLLAESGFGYRRACLLGNLILAGKLSDVQPLSLRSLSRYIHKYKNLNDELSSKYWSDLCHEWQMTLNSIDTNVNTSKSGQWFVQLLDRVARLDEKPLTIKADVRQLSVRLGVVNSLALGLEFFMKAVKHKAEEAHRKSSEAQKHSAQKQHKTEKKSETGENKKAATSLLSPQQQTSAQRKLFNGEPEKQKDVRKADYSHRAASHPPVEPEPVGKVLSPSELILREEQEELARIQKMIREEMEKEEERLREERRKQELEARKEALAAAAAAEEQKGNQKVQKLSPSEMIHAANRVTLAAKEGLAFALDHVKRVSLTVRGQCRGGVRRQIKQDEAFARVQINDLKASVMAPPLRVSIHAVEMFRRWAMKSPAVQCHTRIGPNGVFQILLVLIDPEDPTRRFDYHIDCAQTNLQLFPLLMPGAAEPTLTVDLRTLMVEGPLTPFLNFSRFLSVFDSHWNVEPLSQKGLAADRKKKKEEKKKAELLDIFHKSDKDVAAILLPYLEAGDRKLAVRVRLQVSIAQQDRNAKEIEQHAAIYQQRIQRHKAIIKQFAADRVANTAEGMLSPSLHDLISGALPNSAFAQYFSSSSFAPLVPDSEPLGFSIQLPDSAGMEHFTEKEKEAFDWDLKLLSYADQFIQLETPPIEQTAADASKAATSAAASVHPSASSVQQYPRVFDPSTAEFERDAICVSVSLSVSLHRLIADIVELAKE